MILDSLQNSAKYESLHPAFKQAFDFVKNTDFSKMEPGKIMLNGKDLFVNYSLATGKTEEAAKMETHKDYIDIQIAIEKTETMGYTPTVDLKEPREPYNAEKDITFYYDKAQTFINVHPGQFAIFFPEDGHQPCIAEGQFHKIIVKVKI
ncbi:MAG: YhcH/YjgK/YiaL family protein [Bacteroidales bacterium]|jgi:YhcH/YjgK/YiaL family protein|nr:YhcH/YjgK/YiaL family protein [Bacteroidales bacterium]MBO7379924.1 YhcH/YjgK/YiaL family protein [Bacteroidales bacterium]MBP5214302.1 YhcH/YjgK/YiaL family protein [Bacteroidales bacterium]MBP5763797.1 YhcH/YjgK/YiaL family protein [Bacteroidales bacterium]